MKIYRYFLDGMPWYLAKHYWWAYLWPSAVWFFDHQPVINAILFFQYHKLMQTTLNCFQTTPNGRVLQLTCVYGCLTPKLNEILGKQALHLTDVAEVQLHLARSKSQTLTLRPTRMNAEQLGYKNNVFHTVVLFFLLHEMPHEARVRTLSECMRVLAPGGSLLITEYAPQPVRHWLYRLPFCRWILTSLEPFLDSLWHEDIEALLNESANPFDKRVEVISQHHIFFSFYSVTEYRVIDGSIERFDDL
ncbi:MAG: rhodoquinone biosynthesis methyltransferase RquA [Mariprofundus sp.]|nr:rhodoquinone biosynthesis methyltransferase RquA [Mariprofundus sp.]